MVENLMHNRIYFIMNLNHDFINGTGTKRNAMEVSYESMDISFIWNNQL